MASLEARVKSTGGWSLAFKRVDYSSLELILEFRQEALNGHGQRVSEWTDRVTLNLFDYTVDQFEITRNAFASRHAIEHLLNPVTSLAAWCALTT